MGDSVKLQTFISERLRFTAGKSVFWYYVLSMISAAAIRKALVDNGVHLIRLQYPLNAGNFEGDRIL